MEKEKLVSISERDWHYRLVKFVWDFEPKEFKNLCPYFWLTIASMIVFPFVGVYRMCSKAVGKVSSLISRVHRENAKTSYRKILMNLSKEEVFFIVNYDRLYLDSHFATARRCDYMGRFVRGLSRKTFRDVAEDIKSELGIDEESTDEWRELFNRKIESVEREYNERIRKMQCQIEKNESRKKQRRYLMNDVIEITKNMSLVFMTLVIVLLFMLFSFLLTDFAVLLFTLSMEDYIVLLRVLGFMLCGVIIFCLVIFLYNYVLENYRKISENKVFLIVSWPFSYLFGIILSLIVGIKKSASEFGGIFKEYFKASYSDYCPGIEWKDE